MNRWQQIEDVYHAALERDETERRSFLDEACGGDEELREEVESLLLQEEEAVEFLESPPWEAQIPSKTSQAHVTLLRRGVGYLLAKRTLQLVMALPIVIVVATVVQNRN